MKKAEQIINQVNEQVDKPFVTARFGNNWKEHQKKMLDEGQISIDDIIDIAWRNGRQVVLFTQAIQDMENG